MGEGLWIGLLVGALYMTAEAASGQAIKIWAFNTVGLGPQDLAPARYYTWANGVLVDVHSDDLTRNIVPEPLLLWPALMAASVIADRAWRVAVIAMLVVLSILAVFLATSETTKLALLAGLLAFAVARYAEPLARYALATAWAVACLGVVPAAYLARHFELQNAPWLQLTAQLRITIWNELAQKVPDAPWFGVGANMTYESTPVMHEAPAAVASWAGHSTIPHPHNAFLQTWYELGLVGAVLLMLVGFFMLRDVGRLDPRARPFALAIFATTAVQIAFSYSIWQIWYLCLFGFLMAMLALGKNVLKARCRRLAPDPKALRTLSKNWRSRIACGRPATRIKSLSWALIVAVAVRASTDLHFCSRLVKGAFCCFEGAPADCRHNAHIYYVLLDAAIDRGRVLDAMHRSGVDAIFHYVPLHSSPGGKRYGRAHGTLETTDQVAARLVRLPLWIGLSAADQQRIVERLGAAITGN